MDGDPQFLFQICKEDELKNRVHTTLIPKNLNKIIIFAFKVKILVLN